MPRYIDADEIQYTMLYKENWITNTGVEKQGVWKDDIDKMQTADVVEVVRCKDCKYDHKCSHNIIRPSKGGGVIYCPLEYCSEGERANNEQIH